jgi:PAS domain S-box-containing protein
MDPLFSEIDELIALAEAASGETADPCLEERRRPECEPLLVLAVDGRGRLDWVEDLGWSVDPEMVHELAARLALAMDGKRACRLDVAGHPGCVAMAVRSSRTPDAGFTACVARCGREEASGDDPQEALFVLCGTLVGAVEHFGSIAREWRTRAAHLRAEHETLKHSHAHAVSDAIEEREKRLQQQRRDMAQLAAVMKLAADGIMTVNEEGIITSFNEAAGRIFGYDPAEVIGRDVAILTPVGVSLRHGEDLRKCLSLDQAQIFNRSRETVGRRKDGTVFPMEIAVSVVPLDSGRILTGIFRDIEERRRLESQSVQAQKLQSVGQLAAGIAHEINTPTQFVGDNTRFLQDAFRDLEPILASCIRACETPEVETQANPILAELVAAARAADLPYLVEEIPKAINQSLEGVERVAKIVRSMKDFSHPGGDTKQAIDLNRALESTLTVCRNEWKYVADAVLDFDPHLPLVTCLPGECNQVFLNLIINAAHAIADKLGGAAGEKGKITLVTRRDGDWAEVRISDTGTGIPEEHRARIFDPFFTTKEVGRGTGQGLSIALSVITQKHGGTIRFETEVGRGTTFIVRLPISGEPPPFTETASERNRP